jgi:hypothetical protein
MAKRKSSLKTFLAGENKYNGTKLKNSTWLCASIEPLLDVSDSWYDGELWSIDVLDDGTAITYCYA